jgi:hypothetical protein
VLSLFDYSTYMLKPWKQAGHHCIAVDELFGTTVPENLKPKKCWADECWKIDLSKAMNVREVIEWTRPDIVFGFPDCTDLAVSGAKHFDAKRRKNPNFQREAIDLCRVVEMVGDFCNVPWMLENPVGVLSTGWRKPDWVFHPHEYGDMLQGDEAIHPDWPEFVEPRDCYPKRTGIWGGNGFVMPGPVPATVMPDGQQISFAEWVAQDPDERKYSKQFKKLGGKSLKTKMIRSLTPRGFAAAVHAVNDPTYGE